MQVCVCMCVSSSSGRIGDGFVFFQAGPLACGVVHLEHCVHQHGGAARTVCFRKNLCVLAQLDLDDVALLRTRVLCNSESETGLEFRASSSQDRRHSYQIPTLRVKSCTT